MQKIRREFVSKAIALPIQFLDRERKKSITHANASPSVTVTVTAVAVAANIEKMSGALALGGAMEGNSGGQFNSILTDFSQEFAITTGCQTVLSKLC